MHEPHEGLRFTKQLIDEGLLSPLAYTQDAVQMIATINPDPPKVGSWPNNAPGALGATDPKRVQYIPMATLEGPGGRQQVWQPTLPNLTMVITKNCKTPESAFMLGDYMCSEEMTLWSRFGEKGVDWNVPGPNDKSVFSALGYQATIIPIFAPGTAQNKIWINTGPLMLPGKWLNGQVVGPTDHTIALGRSIGPAIQYTTKNPPVVGLLYNEEEQAIMNEFHSTIISYVTEYYVRFITGDLSIDRDWDNYVAQFNRMGLAQVIQATQTAWDRMNK